MAILNALLQPDDAPVTSERGTIGYQWDTTSDRGMIRSVQIQNASIGSAQIGTASIGNAQIQDAAITSAKINDFNFNQGSGGTLTLGGTVNGNGVLKIKDETGATFIIGNGTALTVYSGGEILFQAKYNTQEVYTYDLTVGGPGTTSAGQLTLKNNGTAYIQTGTSVGLFLENKIPLRFAVGAAPDDPAEGQVYYDSATHQLKYRDNTGWQTVGTM